MKDEQFLERIVLNPTVMVGKPTIRGTRLGKTDSETEAP